MSGRLTYTVRNKLRHALKLSLKNVLEQYDNSAFPVVAAVTNFQSMTSQSLLSSSRQHYNIVQCTWRYRRISFSLCLCNFCSFRVAVFSIFNF